MFLISAMMNSDNKRELSSSSVEDYDDKRQKLEAECDDVPAWARTIIADVAFTRNTTNQINMNVNDMKNDFKKLRDQVEAVEDRCVQIEVKGEATDARIDKLEAAIVDLTLENKQVKGALAKTTDNTLRDNLSFHNIRQVGPEKWSYTKTLLSKFLAKQMAGPNDRDAEVEEAANGWLKKIERAHRGKTNVIHVAFESWVYADEVR